MSLNHPPQPVIDCLETSLTAIAAGNYELFITVGNSAYQEGITQAMFSSVSDQLAPRMAEGYSTLYWGDLKQGEYQVYIWKLSFADDGDEFVIRMTMAGDQVAGMLIT
jgi:hypothetical protein